MMTGNEVLDIAALATIAGLLGAAFGCLMRCYKVPLAIAASMSPVAVTVVMLILWFVWIAVTTGIYGHPNGNHPLLVALGATMLYSVGFAVISLIPSVVGCLGTYASIACWRHLTSGCS